MFYCYIQVIFFILWYTYVYYITVSSSEVVYRHVNATKSYLHFDRFAGEAILCSNFFCFLLFLDVLFLS